MIHNQPIIVLPRTIFESQCSKPRRCSVHRNYNAKQMLLDSELGRPQLVLSIEGGGYELVAGKEREDLDADDGWQNVQ